jgi:hypothetical protein
LPFDRRHYSRHHRRRLIWLVRVTCTKAAHVAELLFTGLASFAIPEVFSVLWEIGAGGRFPRAAMLRFSSLHGFSITTRVQDFVLWRSVVIFVGLLWWRAGSARIGLIVQAALTHIHPWSAIWAQCRAHLPYAGVRRRHGALLPRRRDAAPLVTQSAWPACSDRIVRW